MASNWFDIDTATGNPRIKAVDQSLFMRLSDLIEIIAEESRPGDRVPEEFLRLLDSRLMRTLQTLHSEKKIHGDISPENVLVTHFGGVSLLHPQSGAPSKVTPYNTPFMDVLSPAHDVFGVGCLLYTVATKGQPPFVGRSVIELRAAMAKGCPPMPSAVASREIATLIAQRIRVGLDPTAYSEALFSEPAPGTGRQPSPDHAHDVSVDEMVAALESFDDMPPSPGRRSPPERASRATRVSPNGMHRSRSAGALQAKHSPEHREPVPASIASKAPGDAKHKDPMEAGGKKAASTGLDDHYISPVLAKKLAAAINRERAPQAAAEVDPYEAELAAARREAFNARMALANKHAHFINPVSSGASHGQEEGSLPPRAVHHSADAPMARPSTAMAVMSKEDKEKAALERARKEYFEARMAMKSRHGSDPVNTSAMSADSLGGEVPAPSVPPTAAQRRSAVPRTPPESRGTRGAAGEAGDGSTMTTPQQLRAARLAAEQRAYEESLEAARRQAFQERLALQSRYGRGT